MRSVNALAGLRASVPSTTQTAPGLAPLRLWLAWLAGVVLLSLPLWVAPIPPLGQHFFNLVRMVILSHPDAFARDFVIRWDTMPDLAMDLTVPWLAHWMPVEDAARLFLFACIALLTSGPLVLSRALNGRWSLLPLLSCLLVYNWIFIRGYANNLFGMGLCLWALAAHISLRRSVLARVTVSGISALLIYLCHLMPLGVFGLVAGIWELSCLVHEDNPRGRLLGHAAAALVPFVLPAVLLIRSSTGELGGAIEFGFPEVERRLKLVIEVLSIGNRVSDLLLLAALTGAGALAIARGWLRCLPECRWIAVALPIVIMLVPFSAFASYAVVERCVFAFAFVMTALFLVRPVDPRLQHATVVVLTLVLLVRVGTIMQDWRRAAPMVEAYRQAFARLEPGSLLLQFNQDTRYPSPLLNPARWNPALDKIVALATLQGVLVPELYLKPGQQPVLYRGQNKALRDFQASTDKPNTAVLADDATLRVWLADVHARFPQLQQLFGTVYVAVYDPQRRLGATVPGAELIATLPQHRLYRLTR